MHGVELLHVHRPGSCLIILTSIFRLYDIYIWHVVPDEAWASSGGDGSNTHE